ncbi:hypothetical protein NW762_002972 [Fusarium torreyae]|uniref:AAA+ ATPase domain-containing protein n=1 Tax=Fusarium torreyae TaxID=1237075 RepID=A0A9W8SCC9_9HYPO|nr:hypothetical protein NW762_002972 [Fusarium torreyae]
MYQSSAVNNTTSYHRDAQKNLLDPGTWSNEPSASGPSDPSVYTSAFSQLQHSQMPQTIIENEKECQELFGTDMGHDEACPNKAEEEDSPDQPGLFDASLLQVLVERVKELEEENTELRQGAYDTSAIGTDLPAHVQYFYCLEREEINDSGEVEKSRLVCLSPPEWGVFGDALDLKGRFPIANPEDFAEEHGAVLIIYMYYYAEHQYDSVTAARRAKLPLPEPEAAWQDVILASEEMADAVKAFFEQYNYFNEEFPVTNFAPLYSKIEDQFKRGKASRETIEFLIRPGDILVSKKNGMSKGRLATGIPSRRKREKDGAVRRKTFEKKVDRPSKIGEQTDEHSWAVKTRSYGYDGGFFRIDKELTLDFPTVYKGGEVEISDLSVIPLSYARPEVKEKLLHRGKRFWKLRNKQLVSYEGCSSDKIQTGQRFMVDFDTYKELHPNNSYMIQKGYNSEQRISLLTDLPTDDSEPEEPEIYLFPSLIPGFDLRRKKWVDLEVDQIRDVTWNRQAFSSLVADDDMKELVLALVTNQLDAERNTDLIESKGSGLIMLLHGSPGTGKTFTAESVAEIAKKPLYPVTCGDIGTEPREVEKYLESVFHLGKIWDCVVLLDEAEVFLEQRTLQDLKRNALVSVFLRALEYYEGILILTTNRVGTFDEAFKSRIQLALRYEKLKDYQRKQIWRNFLDRLRGLGEDQNIDFDNIELHLDELAQYPMNGRQIRNSITTGRQLAKYKQKKMTFSHLKRAIDVANKFDRYLADVQEGDMEEYSGARGENGRYSPEYLARVDQIR